MKRLFCVLLCLVLTAGMLVGCGDVDRTDWLGEGEVDGKISGGNYDGLPTVSETPIVTLNLYIIVDDDTCDVNKGAVIPSNVDNATKLGETTQAINTVKNAIKDYTLAEYNTSLNIVYVKADEYEAVVENAVKANTGAAGAANIVLINSYTLMQKLYDIEVGGVKALLPLDSYLDTDKYGQLNTNIAASLLEASKLDGKLYSLPNNHVIGRYEYLIINVAAAQACGVSELEAKAFTSYDEAVAALEAGKARFNVDVEISDVVDLVSGAYEDKAFYETLGYYCNVIKNPTADKNEAFTSSFAIVNRYVEGAKFDANERAMQILYDLNMKTELRNLLQYGVAGTNYKLDDQDNDVVSELCGDANIYRMNLIYTGNVLNAYFCDEIGWTEFAKSNTIAQNNASVTVK